MPRSLRACNNVADLRRRACRKLPTPMFHYIDAAAAPVDCIAPVRRAVGAETEIVVDSGIRRGTHVLKTLALGADACAIGRPYLYGLAAGGQRGVERVLRLLCNELERDMALLGCLSIDEVSAERVLFRND